MEEMEQTKTEQPQPLKENEENHEEEGVGAAASRQKGDDDDPQQQSFLQPPDDDDDAKNKATTTGMQGGDEDGDNGNGGGDGSSMTYEKDGSQAGGGGAELSSSSNTKKRALEQEAEDQQAANYSSREYAPEESSSYKKRRSNSPGGSTTVAVTTSSSYGNSRRVSDSNQQQAVAAAHNMPPAPRDGGGAAASASASAAPSSSLPRLASDWLAVKTTKPWYICRYFGDKKCSRGDECTFIHVQKPWGHVLEAEWRHVPAQQRERLSLPMPLQYFQQHLYTVDLKVDNNSSSSSNGNKRWFTAGFSSVFEQGRVPRKHQNIFYAEGGNNSVQNRETGVYWYETKQEAVEALKRVIIFSFWAYDQGIDRGLSSRDTNAIVGGGLGGSSSTGNSNQQGSNRSGSGGGGGGGGYREENWNRQNESDRSSSRPPPQQQQQQQQEYPRGGGGGGPPPDDDRYRDEYHDERAYRDSQSGYFGGDRDGGGGGDDPRDMHERQGRDHPDDRGSGVARGYDTQQQQQQQQQHPSSEQDAFRGNNGAGSTRGYDTSSRPPPSSNSRGAPPPPSSLPRLDADWLVTKTTKPYNQCRHFRKNRCFAGEECSYVHVHPSFGQMMESEWKNVSDKTLPMPLDYFKDHLYIVEREGWYTAGFSSAYSRGKESKGQNIMIAESGDSAINEQGVHWYATKEEAVEALKRVCTFAFWAYDQGIHPHHPALSGAAKQQAAHPQPWNKYESDRPSSRQLDQPSGGGDPRDLGREEYPPRGGPPVDAALNRRPSAAESDERAYRDAESGYYDAPVKSDYVGEDTRQESRHQTARPAQREARGYTNIDDPVGRSDSMVGGVDQRGRERGDPREMQTTGRPSQDIPPAQDFPGHGSSGQDGGMYDARQRPSLPAAHNPLPSALPFLAADWLTTKTSYPRNLCRHFSKNRCFGADQCTFVHVHPPIGPKLESQWNDIGDKSLPMAKAFFMDHLYIVEREGWFTAGFSSALSRGKESKGQNIIYVESGDSAINEQGIHWYSTKEDAVEALKRVCTFILWMQDTQGRGMKPGPRGFPDVGPRGASGGRAGPPVGQERGRMSNERESFNSRPMSDPRSFRGSEGDSMNQPDRGQNRPGGYSDFDGRRPTERDPHPNDDERNFQSMSTRGPEFDDRGRNSSDSANPRYNDGSSQRGPPQQSMQDRRSSFEGDGRGGDPRGSEQMRHSYNDASYGDVNYRREDNNRDGQSSGNFRRNDNQGGPGSTYDNDNGRGRRPPPNQNFR